MHHLLLEQVTKTFVTPSERAPDCNGWVPGRGSGRGCEQRREAVRSVYSKCGSGALEAPERARSIRMSGFLRTLFARVSGLAPSGWAETEFAPPITIFFAGR